MRISPKRKPISSLKFVDAPVNTMFGFPTTWKGIWRPGSGRQRGFKRVRFEPEEYPAGVRHPEAQSVRDAHAGSQQWDSQEENDDIAQEMTTQEKR